MLQDEACVPCRRPLKPMPRDDARALLPEVPGWQLVTRDGVDALQRTFTFPDFAPALRFTVALGALAEEAGHHPAVLTEWGRVTVWWWTHVARGLHRNDFVMAARTSALATSDETGKSAR
ncbi:MAG: 4a-hydroxytetrahydrobiopterin dehydratase [Myxococcota bacterium]